MTQQSHASSLQPPPTLLTCRQLSLKDRFQQLLQPLSYWPPASIKATGQLAGHLWVAGGSRGCQRHARGQRLEGGLIMPPPGTSQHSTTAMLAVLSSSSIPGLMTQAAGSSGSTDKMPGNLSKHLPRRRPPSLLRPSVGWRVRTTLGPLALACILSSTMCFSFW